MKVLLTCKYCNFSWERNMYMGDAFEERCTTCNDTNIEVKDLAKTKIDAYVGCKPFPEKETEKEVENTDFPFYYKGD